MVPVNETSADIECGEGLKDFSTLAKFDRMKLKETHRKLCRHSLHESFFEI